jgi:hypothetical protein
MANNADDWVRVSRESPCPICNKPDNCEVSRDGSAVWCGRVEEGSTKVNGGTQFLHFLRENRPPPTGQQKRSVQTKEKKKASADFGRQVESCFNDPAAEAKRLELSNQLAAPFAPEYAEALRRLMVGWHDKWWSFPERDATGRFIGLQRRYRDGAKRHFKGSKRGLTYCDNWDKSPGPIYLVEGGSDVAAMLTLGLGTVGRPSNVGGVDLLCELLAEYDLERDIIVVGEKDEKDRSAIKNHRTDCKCCNQCWPGKYGAVRTAKKLTKQLERRVGWTFPPGEAKDVRGWLLKQA